MISKHKLATILSAGLTVLALSWGCSLAAHADSESGGFVWGGGSESGGVAGNGSSTESGGEQANVGTTESGGFYNNGSSTESGGERGNGSSSESGGVTEVGSESESGGPTGNPLVKPTYVKNYNWKQ
jgi:hypothetical protein